MIDPTLPPSAPLAAIDIGSNSFRLEIARIRNGRYQRLDYLKRMVRLGSGLDANGYLTADATERGLATLGEFASVLQKYAVAEIRAVATQTLREARNRNDFLLKGEGHLGHPIEVISGREEARLIYAGVLAAHPTERRRLVVDIGGRSTEFVMGTGARVGQAESFGAGSQSIGSRFFGDGQLTAEAFRQAQVAAGAEFEEAQASFKPHMWDEVMASSGTARALSQLLAQHGVTDGRITTAALAWCIERCIEAGHIDQLQLRGLKEDRRPTLAGGLSILYTLMVQFGIDEIRPARAALRQGVVIDLHQRRTALLSNDRSDVRDQTVQELQRQFRVDADQARRVQAVALNFQSHLIPDLDQESRRELGWACALHEVGMMVSHHDHHRHSAYLLSHVDAAGFSQSQQRRIADLVLGQRGGLRKVEDACARHDFVLQLLCLRLAVIMCHARRDEALDRVDALMEFPGEVRLVEGSANPDSESIDLRTMYLLREEVAEWSRTSLLRLVWDFGD